MVNDSDFINIPTCFVIFDNYVCADSIFNDILSHNSFDLVWYFNQGEVPCPVSVRENEKNNTKLIIEKTTN